MKNIFCLTVVAALIATGCKKDELNITNLNTITATVFWKTATDAQQGINAIYSTFHRVGLSRNQFFITIIRTDEAYSTSPNATLVNNFDKFIITDYNLWETRTMWQDCYLGINRANQVMDNVPGITMDETRKQQLLGEAKFLRGYFYYTLATYWGNVPVLLKTSAPSDYPVTSSQADVYAQAVKDFTEASALLPAAYDLNNIGRATKGAAYAMLGKTYMQQKLYPQAKQAFQ